MTLRPRLLLPIGAAILLGALFAAAEEKDEAANAPPKIPTNATEAPAQWLIASLQQNPAFVKY